MPQKKNITGKREGALFDDALMHGRKKRRKSKGTSGIDPWSNDRYHLQEQS